MFARLKKLWLSITLSTERKALMRAADLLETRKKYFPYRNFQIKASTSQEGTTRIFLYEIDGFMLIKHDAKSFKKHHPKMRWKTFLLEKTIRRLKGINLHADEAFLGIVGVNTHILESNPNRPSEIKKFVYSHPKNHNISKNINNEPFQIFCKTCSAHQYMKIVEKYKHHPQIMPEVFECIQTNENFLFVVRKDNIYMIFEENTNLSEEKSGWINKTGQDLYDEFQYCSTPIKGKTSPYFIRAMGTI